MPRRVTCSASATTWLRALASISANIGSRASGLSSNSGGRRCSQSRQAWAPTTIALPKAWSGLGLASAVAKLVSDLRASLPALLAR